ncbi:hypothetical protein Bca4012_037473 [Brassica carinata]|uniref:Uncharacterized protein n=1 Tax=Brassica carinata TaxID=52824 RepID=A0A8X8BBJ9_BRACI|nr:hypothetical protein Bca52824_011176 [Brassica carinata]
MAQSRNSTEELDLPQFSDLSTLWCFTWDKLDVKFDVTERIWKTNNFNVDGCCIVLFLKPTLPFSPLPVGVLRPLQLTVESCASNTVTCCSQSTIRNIFHLEENELLTAVAFKWDALQVKGHHKRINMKYLLQALFSLRNWEVLSSVFGDSSSGEYIVQQELTFVFHLDGLKGVVMYLIAPPGGIFSSLVVGDRCPMHPRRKYELHALPIQDNLSKENIRNVSLKSCPPEIDKCGTYTWHSVSTAYD